MDNIKVKTNCSYCDKSYVNIDSHLKKCKNIYMEEQRIKTHQEEQQKLEEELTDLAKKYPRIIQMIRDMKSQIDDLEHTIEHKDEVSSWD